MDDIFVIILTLIIAVVGALNQKRKKKGRQAPLDEGGEQQPKQDIWDMLFDQGEQPLVPTPVEYKEEETEVVKEPVFQSSVSKTDQAKYEFKAKSEGVSVFEIRNKKSKEKKKKFKIDGEEFSLKKAVIYSEILNRKYS